MRLPDFLIIGAAKSGTTTLYEYLCRHPQIYMSTPKEPEFFARDDIYAKGMDWYSSLFKEAQPNQVCGEASTIYTLSPLFPNTAKRIAEVSPNVKLIYVMRHPVERAYSFYVQNIKTAQNTRSHSQIIKSFEECITPKNVQSQEGTIAYLEGVNSHLPECPELYLEGSKYMQQIEQYLEFFPRESFLFLLMEDLINNTSSVLSQVLSFLDLDEQVDLIQGKPVEANIASHHFQWYIRSRITEPLRSIPAIKKVAALLPQELRDTAYQVLKKLPYRKQVEKKYIPEKMLPETRQMLLEKFREPNQKLAEFLNRDLSHWSR